MKFSWQLERSHYTSSLALKFHTFALFFCKDVIDWKNEPFFFFSLQWREEKNQIISGITVTLFPVILKYKYHVLYVPSNALFINYFLEAINRNLHNCVRNQSFIGESKVFISPKRRYKTRKKQKLELLLFFTATEAQMNFAP